MVRCDSGTRTSATTIGDAPLIVSNCVVAPRFSNIAQIAFTFRSIFGWSPAMFWDRKKFRELHEDFAFVLRAPRARLFGNNARLGRTKHCGAKRNDCDQDALTHVMAGGD